MRKITCKRLKPKGTLLILDSRWTLPLQSSHVYLGAIISYGQYEQLKAQHRKHAGQAAFSRLRPTLMSQRALSFRKRLHLWRTIVLPSTLYSLSASGYTRKSYDLIRVQLVRQIRAIAPSPRHLTEESDEHMLKRLQLTTIHQMLLQVHTRIVDTSEVLRHTLSPQDVRLAEDITQRECRLLEAIRQFEDAGSTQAGSQARLTCDECNQSFDNDAALRQHKAKKHSELRMSDAPTVFNRQIHAAWAQGLHTTCQFCNCTYNKRNRHAITCHAITQTALERVLSLLPGLPVEASRTDDGPHDRGNSTSGHSGSVRATGEQRSFHGQAELGGATGGDGSGQPAPKSRPTQQRPKGRARKGRSSVGSMGSANSAVESTGARLFFRVHTRGDGDGGFAQAPVTDRHEARGSAENPQAINGLGAVCDDGDALHCAGDDSGVPEVENRSCEARVQVCSRQSSSHPLLESGGAADHDHSGLDPGDTGPGQSLRLGEGGGGMGFPAVVSRKPLPGSGQLTGPNHHGNPPHSTEGAEGTGDIRGDLSLLRKPTVDGEHAGTHGGVPAGCVVSQGSGTSLLSPPGSSAGTSVPSALRATAAQGELSEVAGGSELGRDASMRTLILRNPSNYCYMNSLMRSLLWAITRDPSLDDTFVGAGLVFLQQLFRHRGKPVFLAGQMMFNFALRGWRSPAQQHDSAEFFHHIVDRLGVSAFEGTWEARKMVEIEAEPGRFQYNSVDSGRCAEPITLDIPEGRAFDTQHLLHCWHTQAHHHALKVAPALLLLRFSRYVQAGRRIAQSRSLRSSRPFLFTILLFTIGAQYLFGALHVV